ncbi:MAG: hypothetical protein NTV34_22010 [Proteobacteria bacterium]|nr:hypothetical protein [Pseudomonadota bacterium]
MIRIALKAIYLIIGISASSSYSADTGVAASHMLNRGAARSPGIDGVEPIARVRIPLMLKAWNAVASKGPSVKKEAKIAAKPLTHVLRARIERPNDFYLGDWRIQTTPIRWLKATNQYQVRLEVFRRYGEAGQVEESLGTLNLSAVLVKQGDGLFMVQGSSRRKFNDDQGQPILEIEAGTPATVFEPKSMLSRSDRTRSVD